MTAATARRRIPAVALWGALGVLAWALFAVLLGGSNAHAAEGHDAHARSTAVAQAGHNGPGTPGKGRDSSQGDQGHRASGDRPSSPSWTKPPVTKPPVAKPDTPNPGAQKNPGVQRPKPQKPAPQPPKTHRPVVPDVQDMLHKAKEVASDAARKAAEAVRGRDDDRGLGARPGAWILRPGDRTDQGQDDHRGPRVWIGENPRFGDQQARDDRARSEGHPERASVGRGAPAASWTAPTARAALPAPAVVTPTPPHADPPPAPEPDASGFSPMTPKPATPTTSASGGIALSALATVGETDPLDAPGSTWGPPEAIGISPPAAPVATADVSPD